jgi:protein-disulfide isomerase
MAFLFRSVLLAVFALTAASGARAEDAFTSDRTLGKANAPIKVEEYSSMTCSHCADFYLKTLPELEKRYIDTGKVRLILRDFPLGALSLKAAVVARCMPSDVYHPFVKTLYGALLEGKFGTEDSEPRLYQYAALGGLSMDRAKACANDPALQNAVAAIRTEGMTKYNVQATPTFIINDGEETINGALSVDAFAAVFDRLLAAKKK